MAEVYDAAGLRHYRDGELLSDSLRIANADQLYGFAAECAIKRALVSLPGCANSGILASKYREHVERLWDLAQVQGIQKRASPSFGMSPGNSRPCGRRPD